MSTENLCDSSTAVHGREVWPRGPAAATGLVQGLPLAELYRYLSLSPLQARSQSGARRNSIAGWLAAATVLSSSTAAGSGPSELARPEEGSPWTFAPDEGGVARREASWDPRWPRLRPEEHAVLGALLLGVTSWVSLVPNRPRGWRASVLFDDAVRDALDVGSDGARASLSQASDLVQSMLILYPFAVDAGAVAWLAQDDPSLALDLSLVNAEAFAVALALIVATKHNVGRIRPNALPCPGSDDDFSCRDDTSHSSFLSGHSTAAFTAAGLTCAHHQFLPLYGDPSADTAACGALLGAAAATALLRIASNRHWPTDTLVSAAVGFATGYGLPYLLHYRAEASGRAAGRSGALAIAGLGGPLSSSEGMILAAGGELSIHHSFPGLSFGPRVELNGVGRWLTGEGGFELRQFIPELRLWMDEIGLGFFFDMTSGGERANSSIEWSAGPSIALEALNDGETRLVFSGRWAPLLEGRTTRVAARVDAGFFRWLSVSAEIERLWEESEVRQERSVAMLGLGGRVPW